MILLWYMTMVSLFAICVTQCPRHFVQTECYFSVICENFDSENWQSYWMNNNYDLSPYCENKDTIELNGYHVIPIHLTLRNVHIKTDHDVIPTAQSDERALIQLLDLSNEELEQTPFLADMENLEKVILSYNKLTTAKLSNIHDLNKLLEIDFSHNIIVNIDVSNAEYRYTNIENINLSHNYIVTVPDAIFDSLKNLKTLDLSHNYIDSLSYLAFEGVKHLRYLNISYNRLAEMDISLFRFNELRTLDVSNNNIKIIEENNFEKLYNLIQLDLSHNKINTIKKYALQNMNSLSDLNLNNNALVIMDKDLIANNSNLNNIDISKNSLTEIPKGLFKGKDIKTISITGNYLEGNLTKGIFEGLKSVTELNLNNQRLTAIDDYAFFGLDNIERLLLNNNNIQTLSNKCFKLLKNLIELDLSYNKLITNINVDTEDLINLRWLSLEYNHLTEVKHDSLQLYSLHFLDISNNNITHMESKPFKSLKELTNLEIANNPLAGILKENTFDGLSSLPTLDISCTLLTTIQNNSFNGMVELKILNVSHSEINELQYNVFANTGIIESIDISHNKLSNFDVNTTELINLNSLLLNNNFIKTISSSFRSLSGLTSAVVSHNEIEYIGPESFDNQLVLRNLDVSFNPNLNLNISLLEKAKHLNVLTLDGIKKGVVFDSLKDISVTELHMSYAGIVNVSKILLGNLHYVNSLYLTHNNISNIAIGAFSNMAQLHTLDLSYNKISFIQPGVFKDNKILHSLNISYNNLNEIAYGLFRGLVYLNTLDISFNNIDNLQNERFYEVGSLTKLIVDHNKITSVSVDDFAGTNLQELSIGENPLPCDILRKFTKSYGPLVITARRLSEGDQNIDGVTCNVDHFTRKTVNKAEHKNDTVLTNIRDILLDHFNHNTVSPTTLDNTQYIRNISREIEITRNNYDNKLKILTDLTSVVVNENNNTNILLDRILKALKSNIPQRTTPPPITRDNATYLNLLSYINNLKLSFDDSLAAEKNSIMNDVESKLSSLNARLDALSVTSSGPKHEQLLANESTKTNSLLTETCVVIILVILVCLVLYKFYKSRMFVRNRFSISTRELPDAMDNSTL